MAYLGVQCFHQFLLCIPSTVYRTPSILLGAGNGDRVRLAFRRLLVELCRTDDVSSLLREKHD